MVAGHILCAPTLNVIYHCKLVDLQSDAMDIIVTCQKYFDVTKFIVKASQSNCYYYHCIRFCHQGYRFITSDFNQSFGNAFQFAVFLIAFRMCQLQLAKQRAEASILTCDQIKFYSAPINSRLNVVVRSPTLFMLDQNGCSPSQVSSTNRGHSLHTNQFL